jgi:prefoldin subunit 5
MESSFEKSKSVYKSKIPDIEQTLELIRLLKSKEEEGDDLITNYSLSDTIYAKAKVETANGKVHLWIGANTMVEFTYTEAIELLQEQLESSILKLQELDEDLYHLRGSSITVEVNMARLFNHNVKIKKLKEAAANSASA